MLRVELTDGSSVELNANSSLQVSRLHRWLSHRTVLLQGEAFFQVAHLADNRPFTVQLANGTHIDVLGTEFSVRNRRNDTKVVLKRGSVRLTYSDNRQTRQRLMRPGDWVELNPAGQLHMGKTHQPDRLMAWRKHQFVFDHTPLSVIARDITEQFGIRVTIADKATARRTITGVIDAPTANDLLNAIEQLMSVRIDRQPASLSDQEQGDQQISIHSNP